MMGQQPTIQDIELQETLENLVMPSALLCEESLSPDDTPEEESLSPYWVDCRCYSCDNLVRLCVAATTGAIHLLQQLLFNDLSLLCPVCSRITVRHGRH